MIIDLYTELQKLIQCLISQYVKEQIKNQNEFFMSVMDISWKESGHGLYLLYHGEYLFSSNDSSINTKKIGFNFDQNDKLILTCNGPEHTVHVNSQASYYCI